MPLKKDRGIIDTNLWISFLLTKNLAKIDTLFKENRVVLLFSQELLDEFIEVAERSKFSNYFSSEDLQNSLSKIRAKSEFIKVKSTIDLCRDIKDNFLVALANDGKATHLITGDKELLVLKTMNETEILTMSSYLASK
ncbi:MAG: putative toxin-antitoxin system toxin component, PIN family [Cyclobacteriaceae bacterium]|nr:putative toxin-antitoxin system toxin component, PIN family [Cyclobacteriaceae bacterium]